MTLIWTTEKKIILVVLVLAIYPEQNHTANEFAVVIPIRG